MKELLEKHGLTYANIAHCCLYIEDMAKFGSVNVVYKSQFGLEPAARVCVAVPMNRGRTTIEFRGVMKTASKVNMHVQSFSEWGPPCVGPYAQSNQVFKMLWLAGNIGLVPALVEPSKN